MQYNVNDFTSHPLWTGMLYIPFIQQTVGVSIEDGLLTFSYHGMNYTIAINQKAKVQRDGSVLVALGRRNKYRSLRKPIGLPSHSNVYFLTSATNSLTTNDIEKMRINSFKRQNTSIAEAFRMALA